MTQSRSIVVPCYNEARNLPNLVARFRALRGRIDGDPWELVLVDNGSTDGSGDILRDLAAAEGPWLRVVTVTPPNVGYGHGIVTGLRAARGEWLAWTHADGQTPPADTLAALDLLATSPDPRRTFVKGRRRGRALRDALFTAGMQAAALALLGESLPDINAQPKAFHRDLLALADRPPVDLSLDLYLFFTARRHGFAVRTLDVHFGAREHGESKWAFNWRSKARNIGRTLTFMRALRQGDGWRSA
jgi:glycosyltransferase involved in cell wall biosynthesis